MRESEGFENLETSEESKELKKFEEMQDWEDSKKSDELEELKEAAGRKVWRTERNGPGVQRGPEPSKLSSDTKRHA